MVIHRSSLLPVLSGVPQGSIFGLLFLVYINDLPNAISHATSYLFADDTQLIKSISSCNDSLAIQYSMDVLAAWLHKWNLPLNHATQICHNEIIIKNPSRLSTIHNQ
jgi:hypothetical protein